MTNSSPFLPTANPLGTKHLEEQYFNLAKDLMLTLLYAEQILAQQVLDASQIDIALATEIAGFQQRTKNGARFLLNRVTPLVIANISSANNFTYLADAAIKILRQELANLQQDPMAPALLLKTMVQQIESLETEISSLLARLNSSDTSFGQFAAAYDATLSAAIAEAGDAVASTSASIDALEAAISQNIEDIVKGGRELGEGIEQLGIGLLTTVTGALEEPEKDDDDDDNDEANTEEDDDDAGSDNVNEKKADSAETKEKEKVEVPDVSYVTNSINVASDGVARQSTAGKNLISNNKKLAAAYQALASKNMLVTVAKVVQVNNRQFLKALQTLEVNIKVLFTEWGTIGGDFETTQKGIKLLADQDAVDDLSDTARNARQQWVLLQGSLSEVRQMLVSN